MRTLIDNVALLVIEDCLIRELPNLFDSNEVASMDDDTLAKLAAESQDLHDERTEQQKRLEVLQIGLAECEKYENSNVGRKCFELPLI
jgi:hypothetical protein